MKYFIFNLSKYFKVEIKFEEISTLASRIDISFEDIPANLTVAKAKKIFIDKIFERICKKFLYAHTQRIFMMVNDNFSQMITIEDFKKIFEVIIRPLLPYNAMTKKYF